MSLHVYRKLTLSPLNFKLLSIKVTNQVQSYIDLIPIFITSNCVLLVWAKRHVFKIKPALIAIRIEEILVLSPALVVRLSEKVYESGY